MKEIKLTQGKVALVDDADYEVLNKFKWHTRKAKNTFYAQRQSRCINGNLRQKIVSMHRQILGLTDPKIFCDHRDRNGLNNQRSNLRTCTLLENIVNRNSNKGSNSKYLGVCLITTKSKGKSYTYWVASIAKNKKNMRLGYFKTEREAALAYNEAAIKFHGEFANLNLIS